MLVTLNKVVWFGGMLEKERDEEKLSVINLTLTDAPACMVTWNSGFRVTPRDGR